MKKEENAPHCECTLIHADIVEEVKTRIPDDERMIDMAEFFKVFGDSTRVKILMSLYMHEMCVCDITAIVGSTQSAVSHQLRILKHADLVKYRRSGKVIYYSLKDDHIITIFNQVIEHLDE